MRSPARLLLHNTAASSGETSSPSLPLQPSASAEQRMAAPPPVMAVDSDMVVILVSLLCALVCVLGLALLSRCSCRRRRSASSSSSSDHPPKGLKKKAIDALPTISFAASPEPSPPAPWSSSSECAICLAEFAEGEGLRVLPRCGHGFHVACVDAWLRSCATCPSCRSAIVAVEPTKPAPAAPMVVVVVAGEGARCGRCGEVAAPSAGGGDATPTFLP